MPSLLLSFHTTRLELPFGPHRALNVMQEQIRDQSTRRIAANSVDVLLSNLSDGDLALLI